MKNKALYIAGAFIVLIGAFFALNRNIYEQKQGGQAPASSHKDATYMIEGVPVALVNGVSEKEAAPGSASKTVTRYFGNEARADFDGDGREDIAFLLTQNSGGSGTFYYVVAALNKPEGYIGSEGYFLGDRIAPQTTEIGVNKNIIVNYADRKPGESFAVSPSVGKTARLILDAASMRFGVVANDFEGEADPSRMTLTMKKWVWIKTLLNNGSEVLPKKPGAFTLEFSNDGRFTADTDCNHMGGGYAAKNGAIEFKDVIMTKMYCAGSQDMEFARMIEDSTRYHFTSRGELILGIKFDSGTMTFR